MSNYQKFDRWKPAAREGSEIAPLWGLPAVVLNRKGRPITPPETRVIGVIGLFIVYILFMLVPSAERVLLSVVGFSFMYHLYYTFGSIKTGENVRGTIRFKLPFTNTGIHIHHWVYCAGFLGLYTMVSDKPLNPFIVGGLLGGIAHGVQFSDWNEHLF